jgi:osmotically inducible protein OsmC
VSAKAPGLDPAEFQRLAEDAKANCPVSKALTGTTITLEASLA